MVPRYIAVRLVDFHRRTREFHFFRLAGDAVLGKTKICGCSMKVIRRLMPCIYTHSDETSLDKLHTLNDLGERKYISKSLLSWVGFSRRVH